MSNIVYITPETKTNCLKIHKEIWSGVQDYTLKQMAINNNNLSKDNTLTYTDVIRHEIVNLQSTKKINISKYVDKICNEHGLKPDNQDTYFGIANLSVSGCSEAKLCIGGSYFGSIYTDMTNTFWLISNKRCMPYRLAYQDMTMNFVVDDANKDITLEFDIVKINFNQSKAYEWFALINVSYDINLNAGQNMHIFKGGQPIVSITIKPSKPINNLSLDLNNGIRLNEDCSDLSKRSDDNYSVINYRFPFTYDADKDYWTLQLQDFVDDDKNISNADCTINLSKFNNNPPYPHISLTVDKQDDSEITLSLNMLATHPIRCVNGMMGLAFTK
jgi:hypothetical protein